MNLTLEMPFFFVVCLTFFYFVFLIVYMFEINVYIEFSFLVDEVSKNTEVNFMNFITICGVKL